MSSTHESSFVNEDICNVRMIHTDKIRLAREKALPDDQLERLATIYRLLGDPTRLKIALALTHGEMCVCDLAAFLDVTESAVSHQLRRLREMAVVKRRRDGQVLYYSLDDRHVETLIEVGLAHAGHLET
jgi:DNA-binding transcriptional ArsR family regulator